MISFSQVAFRSSSLTRFLFSTRETLKVRMDLHQAGLSVKQFVVSPTQTLSEISDILIEDNPNIKSISYFLGENQVIPSEESQSFLHLSLNSHLSMCINGVPTTFEFGQELNTANYFIHGSKLEGELAQNEVPYQDSQVIQAFIKNYKTVLEKKNLNHQSYSQAQLEEGLLQTIASFSVSNNSNSYKSVTESIQNLHSEIAEEKKKIEESDKCAQFAGLFYLTYGLYGWDFTEPVSYLLGLSTEAFILFYFLRHRQNISTKFLFDKKFLPAKVIELGKIRTDQQAHLRFLEAKLKLAQSKIIFGQSKQ